MWTLQGLSFNGISIGDHALKSPIFLCLCKILVYANNLHIWADDIVTLEELSQTPSRPLRNQSYVTLSFTILQS